MITDLETATRIAKRVNSKLREFGIPIRIQNHFVVAVSLLIKEIRKEAKQQRASQNPNSPP